VGSSNDYCGVYNQGILAGAVGPIWLGYDRSLDGGSSFTSSLVPGYPDDKSPYAALSQARTATAGDPRASGAITTPTLIDPQPTGQLDVFAATSTDAGASWTGHAKLTDQMSNPNYEQFDNRAVPFAGDYLWVTSLGSFAYGAWTDWRDTIQGPDPREATEDEDAATADVKQCRTLHTVQTKKGPVSFWSGDLCPHDGGIDQEHLRRLVAVARRPHARRAPRKPVPSSLASVARKKSGV